MVVALYIYIYMRYKDWDALIYAVYSKYTRLWKINWCIERDGTVEGSQSSSASY